MFAFGLLVCSSDEVKGWDRSAALQPLKRVPRQKVCAYLSRKPILYLAWNQGPNLFSLLTLLGAVQWGWRHTRLDFCFWAQYLPPVQLYWWEPLYTLHHILFSIPYVLGSRGESKHLSVFTEVAWSFVIFETWLSIVFYRAPRSPVIFVEALFSCGHGC